MWSKLPTDVWQLVYDDYIDGTDAFHLQCAWTIPASSLQYSWLVYFVARLRPLPFALRQKDNMVTWKSVYCTINMEWLICMEVAHLTSKHIPWDAVVHSNPERFPWLTQHARGLCAMLTRNLPPRFASISKLICTEFTPCLDNVWPHVTEFYWWIHYEVCGNHPFLFSRYCHTTSDPTPRCLSLSNFPNLTCLRLRVDFVVQINDWNTTLTELIVTHQCIFPPHPLPTLRVLRMDVLHPFMWSLQAPYLTTLQINHAMTAPNDCAVFSQLRTFLTEPFYHWTTWLRYMPALETIVLLGHLCDAEPRAKYRWWWFEGNESIEWPSTVRTVEFHHLAIHEIAAESLQRWTDTLRSRRPDIRIKVVKW